MTERIQTASSIVADEDDEKRRIFFDGKREGYEAAVTFIKADLSDYIPTELESTTIGTAKEEGKEK
jgi:hypothetical protein